MPDLVNEKIYYKICDMIEGEFKTLFHPSEIGRGIPTEVWINATQKRVRDGRGENWYISGWHVMETLEEAFEYLKKFKHIEYKVVAECVCGELRKKPSPHNVWLSNKIKMSGQFVKYVKESE